MIRNANITRLIIMSVLAATLILLTLFPARGMDTSIKNDQLAWKSRVDPWVIETGASGQTEFLILLKEQADLSQAATINNKVNKGQFVFEQLTQTAIQKQPEVLAALKRLGVEHRSYWIANMIWARASLDVVQILADRSDVVHIYANPKVRIDLPAQEISAVPLPENADGIEWNIQQVHAPEVWQAGFTGQGAVVGGQDTGYDWDHEALINQYRGWDGSSANHDYNWHDAIHANIDPYSPGNSCGFDSTVPCDDSYHGTHTMGTMVGDDGATMKIGMAPGASWIGCRNMEDGWGTPATYAECYQWFIAPTRIDGSDPRPDLAPDVINNSWSCPTIEGCTDPNILLEVVNNLHAAGIVTVHSAGNDSNCFRINTPAAIYEASFTVGATDSSDQIAGFSSKGPVSVDGSYRIKPNVTAPGVNVKSSFPNDTYGTLYGTSMAAPHVAGMVALLISANPNLSGQVDALENLIEQTALHLTATASCGDVPGTQIPNNTYGWGRIDALAALHGHVLTLDKVASKSYLSYGSTLTYTISVAHIAALPTTNIVISDTLPVGSSFISATLPHIFNGTTVQWTLPVLEPLKTATMTLTIATPLSGQLYLVNESYRAFSDQVTIPVAGMPVTTTIGHIYIFPLIYHISP
jgi:serine protease AprX